MNWLNAYTFDNSMMTIIHMTPIVQHTDDHDLT